MFVKQVYKFNHLHSSVQYVPLWFLPLPSQEKSSTMLCYGEELMFSSIVLLKVNGERTNNSIQGQTWTKSEKSPFIR